MQKCRVKGKERNFIDVGESNYDGILISVD